MDEDKIKKFYDSLLSDLDLKDLLKKKFLDGFDSYEDYKKYGDAIILINKDKK